MEMEMVKEESEALSSSTELKYEGVCVLVVGCTKL